jgi:hypothetical protein
MAADVDGLDAAGTEGQGGPVDEGTITVRGTSLWHAKHGATTTELNVRDEIEISAERAKWTVKPVVGATTGRPVESSSPRVAGYLRRVVAEKERVARRYKVHKPLAKPSPKRTRRPAGAPVPCPLCRPGADATYPGEAWPDCEVCDGEGVVSTEQAANFLAEHD